MWCFSTPSHDIPMHNMRRKLMNVLLTYIRIPSDSRSSSDMMRYCEECAMWILSTQWDFHSAGRKHKKNDPTQKITQLEDPKNQKKTRQKRKGIVIPKNTALIIEQTAIHKDALEVFMLSLYSRALLRSRL